MPKRTDKRERLLDGAKRMFHVQGFTRTTLADVAEAADVPLGNVYYYFKTKDELAGAVIDERIREFEQVSAGWDAEPDPRQRLFLFVERMVSRRELLAQHGCPIGSLTQELDKHHSQLSRHADQILKTQTRWAARQFEALGYTKARARRLAEEFIGRLQGSILMASAFGDAKVIVRGGESLREWLRGLSG